MIKKFFSLVVVLGIIGLTAFWWLTRPDMLDDTFLSSLPDGDAKAGEQVFYAGGCASCHSKPKSTGEAKLVLTGGHEFKTPFGTFYAPNISPDAENGIGAWSKADFANAMKRGVSPKGEHYYPAFPFTSYARMTGKDIADLWAFMQTLPKATEPAPAHDVGFPFNIRRGLGMWKLLYLNADPVLEVGSDPILKRGQYLVEALTHCGECHTPRNAIGGMDKSRWMAGGVSPDGKERIPNITPHADGVGSWSEKDMVYALESGFTPEFDSFGSNMADVVENTAKLPKSDLEAIAAYLKKVAPVAKAN